MSEEAIPKATEEAVLATIRAELVDADVDHELITPEASFDELGIDSLDAAEVVTALEKRYRVMIFPKDLSGLTVAELVSKVVTDTGA